MTQFFTDLLSARPDTLFILAGLLLIAIGVVGSIKTYIDPGKYGRIAALAIGCLLLIIGCVLYARQPLANSSPAAATPAPAASTTPATVSAAPGEPVLSAVCTFNAGPLSGDTRFLPRAKPQPIGNPCHDMKGSQGHIVAPTTAITP
jgi:hypothetical protein